jgi:hypothetical protein
MGFFKMGPDMSFLIGGIDRLFQSQNLSTFNLRLGRKKAFLQASFP